MKKKSTQVKKVEDIKVFISTRDSSCDECGENLGKKAWITLNKNKGALCLVCSDMDHLVLLPCGDAALTRRSKKHSTLSAVVLKWSRTRKRYERQGLLVGEDALCKAEQECLEDSEARSRKQMRQAEKRAELDQQHIEKFAEHIRKHFPGCPQGRETLIAEHACLKYSGRIGRTTSAKSLGEEAIRLAVIAHMRHKETEYDGLLAQGCERFAARSQVEADVVRIMKEWETTE